MTNRLNALFLLALTVAGAGLLLNKVSIVAFLLLIVPAGALLFTVSAFLVFFLAVIFEKAPKQAVCDKEEVEHWLADAPLPQSQG